MQLCVEVPYSPSISSSPDGRGAAFNQILYTHYHRQDLYWYCKGSFFTNEQQLRPLIDVRNWFLLNILRMDGQNLIKFCIHYIIDKIYVCIEKGHFLQICNRVTALDLCQKLFFAQYLEKRLTEFNQILYTHYYWQGLGWYYVSPLQGWETYCFSPGVCPSVHLSQIMSAL